MRRFTKWIDPKLESYRTPRREPINLVSAESAIKVHSTSSRAQLTSRATADAAALDQNTPDVAEVTQHRIPNLRTHLDGHHAQPAIPKTREELFATIQDAPLGILNNRERQTISAILELPKTPAAELIIPADKIVFVRHNEVLGPLTLDRLYRSGFSHFPVVDASKHIIGVIHTTQLNNLEVRETSQAEEILDPGVYYIRADYTLEQVLAAFLRTNCHFFLVVDHYGKITGLLTFANFLKFIFGEIPSDSFDRDSDRLSVAKRKF